MGEARRQLRSALQDYSRTAPQGPTSLAFQEATERLATLCQTLGLGREASALRALVPPS